MIDRDLHRRRSDARTPRERTGAGIRPALAAVAMAACGLAQATALLGGTIALNMGGGGGAACAFNQSVPLTTAQDTFNLSGATPTLPLCGGRTMSAAMHGNAATPAVGLKVSASGPLTTAAAVVHFQDEWIFTPPVGTSSGLVMFPVSFSLDGSVAAGSVHAPAVGRFLDYTLAISDKSGLADPRQSFRIGGRIDTTGFFAQTWAGVLALNNFNAAALPMTAVVELELSVPNLLQGTIDFFNTASVSMTLPPGFTARTSSGLPLTFDLDPGSVPVPVTGTSTLLIAGLLAIGLTGRRRPRRRGSAACGTDRPGLSRRARGGDQAMPFDRA